jgi:hypothetical protein
MTNPAYVKSEPGKWVSEGVRVLEEVDLSGFGSEILSKIQTIFDAMDWPQLIVFNYSGSDRVVAPFVLGVSSEGNPLMRGYQLEGISKSGKGAGWRVFQISKMENVENHQDFFDKDDFGFVEYYPWIYKVYKML